MTSTTPPVSGNSIAPGYRQADFSSKSRVERWFFTPIEKLKSKDDGFAILILLFPLYEKYLKVSSQTPDEIQFSNGNKVFEIIGKDLGVSKEIAYVVWQHFRNGLLHHAMIKESTEYSFHLCQNGEAIHICDVKKEIGKKEIGVNPFKMREILLKKLKSNMDIWQNDSLYKLAYEYEPDK